ncbi:MAG: DMT family transporter [Paracoccaceae bacterium]
MKENLRGILFMLLAMAGFAIEDGIIKSLTKSLPVSEILIVTGASGALLFAVLAFVRKERLVSRHMLRKAFLIRLLADMLAPLFFISSLALIPLSMASSILQAVPILVTMGAALVLGQQVGWRRWSAIGVGFLGVLIIMRPGFEGFEPAAVLAVIGAICLAARDLATRVLKSDITTVSMTAYAFAASVVAGVILIPTGAPMEWTDPNQTMLLLCITLLGGLSYSAIVMATRDGDVAVIAPFRYARLVFAMLIGIFFLGERPDTMTFLGAGLIILSGLYTFWREKVTEKPT